MLNDDDRVAQIDQPVQHVEQPSEIVEMEAGCRLVEQVERLPRVGPRKLGRQLHPLGLAAGERRRGLPESEVVEADVAERLQDAADLRDVGEQFGRLADGHVEHVADRPPAELDGQRLRVVSPATARLALDPHVREEVHLDAPLPVPFALFAAAPRHVEAEPPLRIAADLRLGKLGVEVADQLECPV